MLSLMLRDLSPLPDSPQILHPYLHLLLPPFVPSERGFQNMSTARPSTPAIFFHPAPASTSKQVTAPVLFALFRWLYVPHATVLLGGMEEEEPVNFGQRV